MSGNDIDRAKFPTRDEREEERIRRLRLYQQFLKARENPQKEENLLDDLKDLFSFIKLPEAIKLPSLPEIIEKINMPKIPELIEKGTTIIAQ